MKFIAIDGDGVIIRRSEAPNGSTRALGLLRNWQSLNLFRLVRVSRDQRSSHVKIEESEAGRSQDPSSSAADFATALILRRRPIRLENLGTIPHGAWHSR